uniref:Uncharacterized protein n=1 Tax=Anguilla anguilla TaxID=7936 RepID=A0A0E9QPN3_ANGAN
MHDEALSSQLAEASLPHPSLLGNASTSYLSPSLKCNM